MSNLIMKSSRPRLRRDPHQEQESEPQDVESFVSLSQVAEIGNQKYPDISDINVEIKNNTCRQRGGGNGKESRQQSNNSKQINQ